MLLLVKGCMELGGGEWGLHDGGPNIDSGVKGRNIGTGVDGKNIGAGVKGDVHGRGRARRCT